MNRHSALYPEHRVSPSGDHLRGLFMGRVLSVDETTYTAKVEVEDGSISIQATVMTLRAFDARGWTWLPEEGELVVVAFLGGAKTRPVILGSMFDSRDNIPNTNPGTVTLQHKSGTSFTIDENGDLHLTHANGADITLDSDSIVVNQRGAGQIELRHENNQGVVLTGTEVQIQSADGNTTITADNSKATVNSNGSKVEVNNDGAINIFPAAGQLVNLGAAGSLFVVRDGDFTGPPIGPLPSHTHQIISSSTSIIIGS